MSHEITTREGGFAEAAFSLQPAWHGLGTVFDHVMDSGEALSAAGLDWRVVQKPVAIGESDRGDLEDLGDLPEVADQISGTKWIPTPGFLANVRDDNNLLMGLVTDHYKVVQNNEAFKFLDALVEGHEMRYESAFSLYGGRRVVMLAQMPGTDKIVEDDHILRYILLSLSHDGTEAIKFGPVATRVVCANTYAFAMSEGTTKGMSIRHSGNIKEKLRHARDILGIASRQFEQYAEHSKLLAARGMAKDEWKEFLNLMCPKLDPRDADYTERRATAVMDTRVSITRAYHNERQATAPQTCWAAYNAVAEHIDHLPRRGRDATRKAEARFNTTISGVGMTMKDRAFHTACRFAEIETAG